MERTLRRETRSWGTAKNNLKVILANAAVSSRNKHLKCPSTQSCGGYYAAEFARTGAVIELYFDCCAEGIRPLHASPNHCYVTIFINNVDLPIFVSAHVDGPLSLRDCFRLAGLSLTNGSQRYRNSPELAS